MSAKVSVGKFEEPKFPARCAWSGEEADTTYTVYGRTNGWRPGSVGRSSQSRHTANGSVQMIKQLILDSGCQLGPISPR